MRDINSGEEKKFEKKKYKFIKNKLFFCTFVLL